MTVPKPAMRSFSAEASHQNYLRKHRGGDSCHFMRE